MNRRNQHRQVVGEYDRDRRHRAGVHHGHNRPSEQECAHSAVGLAKENILTARHGHHGGQLGNRERAGKTHQRRRDPNKEQKRGRVNLACDAGGNDENAGAYRGARDDRQRIEQGEARFDS